MPNEAIARYQNCLSAQIFTINQFKLMQRIFGQIDHKVDLHHTAVFKDRKRGERFALMLFAKGYWIDSFTCNAPDSYVVHFHHQVEKFHEDSLTHYTLNIVNLVEELKGRYCNWEIETDPKTKSVICSPDKHDKPLTEIYWHSFQSYPYDYEDACSFLFQDQAGFTYKFDEKNATYYS